MAVQMQMCERKYGDSECPLHPGNKVISSCDDCKELVCIKCMTSKEHHKGHSFTEIENTVNINCNIIGKFIEHVQSTLLPDLVNKIQDFKNDKTATEKLMLELKKILKERHREILQLLNTHMQTLYNEIEKLCGKNIALLQEQLESLKNTKQDLIKSITELGQVIKEQSPITVFDASQNVKQMMTKIKIPNKPDLCHVDLVFCLNSVQYLVQKALGEIKLLSSQDVKKSNNKSEVISNKNLHSKHTQNVYTIATIPNKDPNYYSITPVMEEKAWCGELRYDKTANTYHTTNKLCLINSQGHVQKILETCASIWRLCIHLNTLTLYGTFSNKTICTIDTSTGTTTTVIRCPYVPCCLTITPNRDIIVGELWKTHGYVYKYSPDGQLLYQSKGKYTVRNLTYLSMNDQVAVACDAGGVKVMDGTLNCVLHTLDIECYTAVYDIDGSLMIGDYHKKEIIILDGKTFSTIKSIKLPEISCPHEITVFGSSMWVKCLDPYSIIHAMFQ